MTEHATAGRGRARASITSCAPPPGAQHVPRRGPGRSPRPGRLRRWVGAAATPASAGARGQGARPDGSAVVQDPPGTNTTSGTWPWAGWDVEVLGQAWARTRPSRTPCRRLRWRRLRGPQRPSRRRTRAGGRPRRAPLAAPARPHAGAWRSLHHLGASIRPRRPRVARGGPQVRVCGDPEGSAGRGPAESPQSGQLDEGHRTTPPPGGAARSLSPDPAPRPRGTGAAGDDEPGRLSA